MFSLFIYIKNLKWVNWALDFVTYFDFNVWKNSSQINLIGSQDANAYLRRAIYIENCLQKVNRNINKSKICWKVNFPYM